MDENVKTPWYRFLNGVPAHLDYFQGSMFDKVMSIAEKYPNNVLLTGCTADAGGALGKFERNGGAVLVSRVLFSNGILLESDETVHHLTRTLF